QVGGPTHLVSSEADVAALELDPETPIAYVTQTTLSIDDTKSIIMALKRKFGDVVGPDTSDICYATQNRQLAVRELCKVADIVIVVGAKNSSNSNRLKEIGHENGVPSYLIADAGELDAAWLEGKDVVGLTAGASAPERLVTDVIEALRRLNGMVEVTEMDGKRENIAFRLPAELRG